MNVVAFRLFADCRMFSSVAFLLWTASAQAANCAEPIAIEQLNSMLDESESAYRNLDDNYPALAQKVLDAIPCMGDLVPRETAARLHREVGLQQLMAKQETKAQQAFAAARTIQSYYTFPEDLVPPNHPARTAYEALSIESAKTTPIPSPQGGSIRLDGDISLDRPSGWPVLFQMIDLTGKVVSTEYLWPETPLPNYPTASKKQASGGGSASPLAPVGIVGGIVSAGLLGAGAALWVTGGADYDSALCDEASPAFNGVWCNENAVPRVGIGRTLTIIGGLGLVGSGLWMTVGPGQMTVGGSF